MIRPSLVSLAKIYDPIAVGAFFKVLIIHVSGSPIK